jgi:hypothetical protein
MTNVLKQPQKPKTDENKSQESATKESAEQAHIEALSYAVSTKLGNNDSHPKDQSPSMHRGFIGKSQKEASFNRTMKHVRAELSSSSRAFSKFIHIKTVERISEILCSTIARPNAILVGNISAFLVTLGVYLLAKNIGYQLSGFETIGSFIVGWVIGIIYDYLRVLITGKSS